MSFLGQLTHTISTTRLVTSAGIKTMYEPVLTAQPCLIQPVTAEFAAKTGMIFGRSYNCFLPANTNITISDLVTDQDGKKYAVSGTLNRNYGRNAHLTVYLTEQAKQGADA